MAEPTDIIDDLARCSAPAVPAPAHHGVEDGASNQLAVLDDLPMQPAIKAAELDVVERFFADILDAVLRDVVDVPRASLRHKSLP